jgi:MFS transporter, PPP family, 3-phenylpropionic acid transporter
VLTLRLFYFASSMGNGAVMPLLALAMQARGFRPTQYAWLMALLPLSRLLAPPVWGALADRFFGTARLLRLNTWLTALAMLALATVDSFLATIVAFGCYAFASSSITPLLDASAYRLLGDNPSRFGYVRVFGSIGFALGALGMSMGGIDARIRAPFMLAACGFGLASLVARRLPASAPPARNPLSSQVRQLARRADVLLLWLGSVLYYLAHGAFDVYFGPYARATIGVSAETVSSAWVLGVASEIVLLWFVPRVIESRFRGGLLLLATFTAAVRWSLIANATSAADLWLQQPLHGITFGVWYLAFLHENQARAPAAIRATVQGVASACMGLGMITATLVGGYVFELLGGRALYRCASVFATLALLCYAARLWLLRRHDKALASSGASP